MMMNKSMPRVVATLVAIACATAAQAEQADGPAFAAPAVDGPSYRDGSVSFDFKDRDGKSLGKATTLQPADSQPARLPDTAGWAPMLVVSGLMAMVGAILLMTRRRMRRLPWETDETEAHTARGREKRLAEELRTLWDKTTTTETLRPRDEPKPGHAVPK